MSIVAAGAVSFALLLLLAMGCAGFFLFGTSRAWVQRGRSRSKTRSKAVQCLSPLQPKRASVGIWPALLRWMLLLLAPLAALAAVLAAGRYVELDPLEAVESLRRSHIASTLNPEKLVPPPALPPALFLHTERPALETADRDWKRLDPAFAQTLLHLFERMRQRGYEMALLEGYRSPERQDRLAALGPTVTNARAFQSKHQYGIAADLAPLRDGALVISERDPWAAKAYEVLGEEARAAGLVWGGSWWFRDLGHVESSQSIADYTKARTPSTGRSTPGLGGPL